MELLNLRDASLKYKKPVEIETALAWNAVKKFLEKNNKIELYNYISAIKIREKNITIFVKKPIIKTEFLFLQESLQEAICKNLENTYDSHKRTLKIL